MMKRLGNLAAGAAVMVFGLVGAGCSSGTPKAAVPDAMPEDFGVAVVVYSPELDATIVGGMPRAMRPARYIVEPERTLRAAVGAGADVETFPPATRQLDEGQVEALWRVVKQGGFAREDHPREVPNEMAYQAGFGRPVALITVTHSRRRQTAAIPLDAGDADAQAALLLVDQLAEWAWVRR